MSKENARRRNSGRGAVLGSSAAPAMSEVNILLNKQKGGNVKLTVHGRNEPEITFHYAWGTGDFSGRLVESGSDQEQGPIIDFLKNLDGESFKREDVVNFFVKKGLSASSADRAIKNAKDEGWIGTCIDEKSGKPQPGRFRRSSKK
jgi:hypothetical protein